MEEREHGGIRRDTRVQIGAPSKMRYITSPLMNIFIELIYHSPLIPIRREIRKGEGELRLVNSREKERKRGEKLEDGKRSVRSSEFRCFAAIFYCENQLTLIIDIRGISTARGCSPRSMAIKTRSNCLWYLLTWDDESIIFLRWFRKFLNSIQSKDQKMRRISFILSYVSYQKTFLKIRFMIGSVYIVHWIFHMCIVYIVYI